MLLFASWTSWDLAFHYLTMEPAKHMLAAQPNIVFQSDIIDILAIQFSSSRQINKFLGKSPGKMSKTSSLLHLEWSYKCYASKIVIGTVLVGFGYNWQPPFTLSTHCPCVKMWKSYSSMDMAEFHIFSRLGRFSYPGTADVREMMWTERMENCWHKMIGKLRKYLLFVHASLWWHIKDQRRNIGWGKNSVAFSIWEDRDLQNWKNSKFLKHKLMIYHRQLWLPRHSFHLLLLVVDDTLYTYNKNRHKNLESSAYKYKQHIPLLLNLFSSSMSKKKCSKIMKHLFQKN